MSSGGLGQCKDCWWWNSDERLEGWGMCEYSLAQTTKLESSDGMQVCTYEDFGCNQWVEAKDIDV